MRLSRQDKSISKIQAREILDSKGRPMVEVDVWVADGSRGRGSSPCGTSVGRHEAFVLRDGTDRFKGLGVQKAVENVHEIIAPTLLGQTVFDQPVIDHLMIKLDGTPNKSNLGANAIYSVSIAVARAAANALGIPLYRYLGGVNAQTLPIPIFNVINGGPYSHADAEFQEFILIPSTAKSYSEALRMSVEVFYRIPETIKKRYGSKHLAPGHLAGYATPVGDPAESIETLLEATEAAGYGGMFRVGLDCAASHFYDREHDLYNFRGEKTSSSELIDYLEGLCKRYPIAMIEDPLNEDDFHGHTEITKRLGILIIGDDLFVTNIERLKRGSR